MNEEYLKSRFSIESGIDKKHPDFEHLFQIWKETNPPWHSRNDFIDWVD